MKIVIGEVMHETNTFSNVPTTRELFELWEWARGDEIVSAHAGVRDFLGGMVDGARQRGIEVVGAFAANAYPAGTITKETFDSLQDELLSGIANAGKVDAICLSLHGAGVAEGVDDLEGALLKAVRQQVGYDIPLIVTLDLHGNITDEMIQQADILLGVHLYPHTDCYERGLEAVQLAEKMVKGELAPRMHRVKLPLIVPTSTTNLSPAKDINEVCYKWEREPGMVDCAFFHGFPYTDIPELGVTVVAVSNGDEELAKRAAEDVASLIWEKRMEFEPQVLSPREGLEMAKAATKFPVVLNETSDNPGGGTPGDGTYLLRAMLEADLQDACFGFIYDPEVAALAHEKGVGATIEVQLGGKTDNLHGEPITLTAYVKALTDGKFITSSPMGKGSPVDLGKSVRLQANGVDILVCSVKTQVLDEQVFLLHGIDVTQFKIVSLKSSQHFRASFEPLSAQIITVDSPGLTTLRFQSFDYKRLNRPVHPLDPVPAGS
ncbi:M81 family metallopeptidase [Brevibacillus choshinensis]|uniref:M81 family metallopeptidase n=1 Tax=Brevibacillus choshinensis TaxID=54911 RepID=A0ABX7FY02_BRECH|nr:M81 family metallopeptidase [Brevibacillus choshinensis]QRG70700.1 M81 family metallopeptidase [Brevibacillus choshinensis]